MATGKDKLEAARRARSAEFPDQKLFPDEKIGGLVLQLHKWTFDQTLSFSEVMMDAIKMLSSEARPKALTELMKRNLGEVLKQYGDAIKKIAASTVVTGNFDSIDEANEWVSELSSDEFVRLLVEIGKRNLVPLVNALGVKNIVLPPELKQILDGGGNKDIPSVDSNTPKP